jgi:DNA-binding CsgD family transcriptional regulator
VWRHGLFREGAAQAQEYEQTARRFGAHRDRADALLLMARARAALGEFGAADEAIAEALPAIALVDESAELADGLSLARLGLMHFRDGDWPGFLIESEVASGPPTAASLLLAAQRGVGEVRSRREAEARAMLPGLLEAAAHQQPLTLYRDAALVAALAAAWELGAADHAATGRSLIDLATETGAGGQLEATLPLTLARMLALAGDIPAARDILADERPNLDRTGQRPLRAIADHDEAIALAAAGKQGYAEAARLLEAAALQFEALGMNGWLKRTRDLLATGFEAASAPGGRLSFTYPQGLSRREADVVRLLAGGASSQEVAATLLLDESVVERLVSSALEKLGTDRLDELPRLARRYGLGGT